MAKPVIRPKDAATIILVRRQRRKPYVLMGMRHSRHAFMPDRYVFPGGRVVRADHYVEPAVPLAAAELRKIAKSCTPAKARALALAAVRETFEETGLILGRPLERRPQRPHPVWASFFAAGYGPDLGAVHYICRAITPTYRPRRFNTRFFVAEAQDLAGELEGDGELVDLHWVPIGEAKRLEIPRITDKVLDHLVDFLELEDRRRWRIPFYHQHYSKHVLRYE